MSKIDEQLEKAAALQLAGLTRRAIDLYVRCAADPESDDYQRAVALGRVNMMNAPAYWDEAHFLRKLEAIRLRMAGHTLPEICDLMDIGKRTLDRFLDR